MDKQDIAFFYFKELQFDTNKILEYIKSLNDTNWLGSGTMRGYRVEKNEHHDDGKMWTANNLIEENSINYQKALLYTNSLGKVFTDFSKCSELNKIMNYFLYNKRFLFTGMILKKTVKGHEILNPLMRNTVFETTNSISKTFDIVIPIQGDFVKNPLVGIRKSGEKIVIDKPMAYIVSNEYPFKFSWVEETYDYRYTFHLSGYMPKTFEIMKGLYYDR